MSQQATETIPVITERPYQLSLSPHGFFWFSLPAPVPLVERTIATWGSAHALGRVATVEEVGAVIAFLASPRASFITGADIRVDGGLLARIASTLPDRHAGS